MQYERNDVDFHRGTFRVRGDVVEVFPPYEERARIRIEFFGDEIESIKEIDPLRGKVKGELDKRRHLSRLALRHAAQTLRRGDRDDPGGAARAPPTSRREGKLSREAAARAAHACTTSR